MAISSPSSFASTVIQLFAYGKGHYDLACPIIQGSPYVVSLSSNDMSVHTTREPTLPMPYMYFSLYRAFGASIGSLDVQSMYYKPC